MSAIDEKYERERKDAMLCRDADLHGLAKMKDEEIDLSDIPKTEDWTGAQRGAHFLKRAPQKKAI